MTDQLDRTATALLEGAVALVPTDTVYGLAVRPDLPDAIRRVFEIKNRPPARNLPVMVASATDLADLGVEITEPARRLLESDLMPGPVTLALGFGPGPVPPWLAGRDEVAVRIPGNPWLQDLLRLTGPLLVTSANVHAQDTLETVVGILGQLQASPDIVVDGGSLAVVPSTLVNCRKDPPVIEREGAVPTREILEVLA